MGAAPRAARPAAAMLRGAAALALCAALGMFVAGSAQAQSIAQPVQPKGESSLPGGASSLSETHDDWTVGCSVRENNKQCIFSQALGNQQTGRRVLSIELRPSGEGQIEGVILAPFGLRLADGISLKVGDKVLASKLAFTTCIDQGCIVPVTFKADEISALASGEQLVFTAVGAGQGEPVTLNISLKGFTAARQRVAELMQK